MLEWLLGSKDYDNESESYMRALREYKKLSQQDFINVQKRLGVDGASSFAHLYFDGAEPMQRLKKELELQDLEYSLDNNKYEVIVVAPDNMFGYEYENDKLVTQMTRLSLGAGFHEVTRVNLKGASAIEGARQLSVYLKNRTKKRKYILVSFSHSSASVRIMLDQMKPLEWKPIQGWLNISGLIFGSPHYFCSTKKQMFFHRSREARRSYSSEQRYFLKPVAPYTFKSVHLLGIKHSEQMSVAEQRKVLALKPWGPNDGLVPFSSYQRLRAPVLSVLGQGHMIDLEVCAQTIRRSLCAMVSLIPKKAPVENWNVKLKAEPSAQNIFSRSSRS